jgi:transposase-like protein
MSNHSKKLAKVVNIDDAKINNHLWESVRDTLEETLNAMLDAEADSLCGAQRYERSPRTGRYSGR